MKEKIISALKALAAMLVFWISGYLFSELLAILLMKTNINNELLKFLYETGCSLITLLISFPLFILIMKICGNIAEFSVKPKIKLPLKKSAAYLIISLIPMIILYGIEMIMIYKGKIMLYEIFDESIMSIMHTIIFSCIIMPFAEEFIFRGFLLHKLLPLGRNYAIAVTTVLFVLGHTTNPVNMLLSVVPGIIFAKAAAESEGIGYGIVYHIIINTLGQLIIPALISLL